jgi:hypothetical protein
MYTCMYLYIHIYMYVHKHIYKEVFMYLYSINKDIQGHLERPYNTDVAEIYIEIVYK